VSGNERCPPAVRVEFLVMMRRRGEMGQRSEQSPDEHQPEPKFGVFDRLGRMDDHAFAPWEKSGRWVGRVNVRRFWLVCADRGLSR